MGQDDAREGGGATREGGDDDVRDEYKPCTRREITSRMRGDKEDGDGVKSFNYGVRRVHFDKLIGMSQKAARKELVFVVDNRAEQARISDQGSGRPQRGEN